MRKRSKKGWRLLLAEYSRASESTDAQNVYVHYSPVIDNKIVKSRRDCAAKNACGTRPKRSHFQPCIRSMLVRVHRRGNKSSRCVSRAERLGGQ